MSNRPNDYINRAELGISVAKSWVVNYPDYNVNFITKENFTLLTQKFQDRANQNANQDAVKKENTAKLKRVNAEIKKGATRLKEYIRDSYSTNIEAMYAAYGFEKIDNTYTFPSDNDRRMQRLGMLLSKLQEVDNPIANRNQGLVYWESLITTHSAEWLAAKSMKMTKAQLSQDCKDLHKEIGSYLSKIFRQISLDFPRDQVASVRRSFGFLNETYK